MAIKKTYYYAIDTSALDRFGFITPEGYQRIVLSTTEKELERIQFSIAHLIKTLGVSWILLSLSVKVLKQIKPGQELSVTTWHTWRKGVLYRRDFEICDKESGEPYAYATTFSSLFDVGKRRLCTSREIYEKITLEEGEELFEAQSRSPVSGEFEFCEKIAVRPHWIDSLGHVNNFKYAQVVYDNLPPARWEESGRISRIEMFFTGELRYGDNVIVKRKVQDSSVEIAGEHEDGKSAFLYKIHY